jgi:phosphoserine phosphatase RsbU/P
MTSLLFLIAATLFAQVVRPTIHADLSGEWRISTTDDPSFSDPKTSDTTWNTVQLPWSHERPIGVYWLRRTIPLPPGVARQQLAMAFGSVNETYELYINGTRIAATPGFGTDDPPFFAPRVFPLPESLIQSDTLTVALRIWRPQRIFWLRSSFSADRGPYLLASLPAASGAADNARLKSIVSTGPFLLFSPFTLFIGIYLLWTFRTAREWRDLLWLGCYCISVFCLGAFPLALSHQLVGSLKWFERLQSFNIAFALISLTEFSAAVFRITDGRWRWFVWPLLLLVRVHGMIPVIPAALCVFWGFRQLTRRSDTGIRLTAALVATYTTLRLNYYLASVGGVSLVPLDITAGPVVISTLALMSSLIAAALMFVTLQRLLRDKSEKQRLAAEVEAARVVQQILLARAEQPSGEYTIEAVYTPAQEVGGDFYYLSPSNLIAIGDVSGKGLKAAMVVSLITGALRNSRSQEPSVVLAELNRTLAHGLDGGFVTCSIARLDPSGEIRIANAGHLAPFIDGNECEIDSGLPLGIAPDAVYAETTIHLPIGKQLTLVSDGVVEAQNAEGELYGFDRTRSIATEPAAEIAKFAQAFGQTDDITVVTIRRTV